MQIIMQLGVRTMPYKQLMKEESPAMWADFFSAFKLHTGRVKHVVP